MQERRPLDVRGKERRSPHTGEVFAAGSRLSQQQAVAAIKDRLGSRAQPS